MCHLFQSWFMNYQLKTLRTRSVLIHLAMIRASTNQIQWRHSSVNWACQGPKGRFTNHVVSQILITISWEAGEEHQAQSDSAVELGSVVLERGAILTVLFIDYVKEVVSGIYVWLRSQCVVEPVLCIILVPFLFQNGCSDAWFQLWGEVIIGQGRLLINVEAYKSRPCTSKSKTATLLQNLRSPVEYLQQLEALLHRAQVEIKSLAVNKSKVRHHGVGGLHFFKFRIHMQQLSSPRINSEKTVCYHGPSEIIKRGECPADCLQTLISDSVHLGLKKAAGYYKNYYEHEGPPTEKKESTLELVEPTFVQYIHYYEYCQVQEEFPNASNENWSTAFGSIAEWMLRGKVLQGERMNQGSIEWDGKLVGGDIGKHEVGIHSHCSYFSLEDKTGFEEHGNDRNRVGLGPGSPRPIGTLSFWIHSFSIT